VVVDEEVTGVGEFVNLQVDDGIGTIRLDRPPVNAINQQLHGELRQAAAEAAERADVHAVVVYGGPKAFAGGADIKEMADLTYAQAAVFAGPLTRSLTAVAEIPKPTVAAVTGYALGGGLELALCCDRRVCGDNVKLGQPEILLGIIPGAGGTQRLSRLVGPARAKDIIYSGRYLKADEALGIGLVDEVVAPDDVYTSAVSWARQFVGGPLRAYAAAKAAVDGGLDGDLNNGLKLETTLFTALFGTEDQKTGMHSFIENGPGKATFTGK
jgi:enoyl-CoA hydratase